MTPAEIAVKWLRKLKEETALTSARGAHARKKSSTSGAPEITSLVRRAGFDVLGLYGGLAGSALGWDSPRVNVVARLARNYLE